jgi:protein-L-isoaspartate(D-aspartate) O-methyltransferase
LWLRPDPDISRAGKIVGYEGCGGVPMSIYEAARTNMVESQLRPNKVTDERVLAAFMRVRRELFVPERMCGVAYVDDDLPLGDGRYLIKPLITARLLQAAAVAAKDTALVVGAGVGYEAALLALLARKVVALEESPNFARIGRSALVDHRIASVSYVEAPLASGHRQRSPYDVILFGGAVTAIPDEISGQLAEGGRIAVVLRSQGGVGRATLLTRTGGALASRVIFDAVTPLLPSFVAKPVFSF